MTTNAHVFMSWTCMFEMNAHVFTCFFFLTERLVNMVLHTCNSWGWWGLQMHVWVLNNLIWFDQPNRLHIRILEACTYAYSKITFAGLTDPSIGPHLNVCKCTYSFLKKTRSKGLQMDICISTHITEFSFCTRLATFVIKLNFIGYKILDY